jgi:hypothetical protein
LNAAKESLPQTTELLRRIRSAVQPAKPKRGFKLACAVLLTVVFTSVLPLGGLRHFKVVKTIEGLDRPTETTIVKGPRENYLTARVADPSNLTKMRIGETIVVTDAEALAISLEKAWLKSAN